MKLWDIRNGWGGEYFFVCFVAIDHIYSVIKSDLSYCPHISSDSWISAKCNDHSVCSVIIGRIYFRNWALGIWDLTWTWNNTHSLPKSVVYLVSYIKSLAGLTCSARCSVWETDVSDIYVLPRMLLHD